jgi:SulP family sulfate permease
MRSFKNLLSSIGVSTTGYRPQNIATDLPLGFINGLDTILWCFTASSLIFTGILSGYLPLAITLSLISTAILATVIATTSNYPVNIANVAEQGVVILATISLLLNNQVGAFANNDAAAATMFVIMSLSTLLFGICLNLTARFDLGLLLQLIPFPVVCGFLAGTGWLFFSAGINMMTDLEVDFHNFREIFSTAHLIHWIPAFACGLATTIAMRLKDHYLTLPICLVACVVGFYTFAFWQNISLDMLRDTGWVYKLDNAGGEKSFSNLDFLHVNFNFIASVLPEIASIILICMLSTSFAFSALELGSGKSLSIGRELKSNSVANITNILTMSPPGMTDAAFSMMFIKMGASSRLTALVSSGLCLFAACLGGGFVEYVPKLLVGTLVFMIAVELIYEWLIESSHQMNLSDTLIVWIIFVVIVGFDLIPGILLGVLLTSLMFIVRYSKIEIVGSNFSLKQLTSSVDRSVREINFLKDFSVKVEIFNLRGFLFFGSANIFFERMKEICSKEENKYSHLVFDFRRVLGIDSTATQVFIKLINLLESNQITPIFCGMNHAVEEVFKVANVFDKRSSYVFKNLDLALIWVEESLLANRAIDSRPPDINSILTDILGESEKANQISKFMIRKELKKDEYLFRQGDIGSSFYVIESGKIEICLENPSGLLTRLREFRGGTVVGEMAAYSINKSRSASALAIENSIVYEWAPENIKALGKDYLEYEVIVHEFIARLLSTRLLFMNNRSQADL